MLLHKCRHRNLAAMIFRHHAGLEEDSFYLSYTQLRVDARRTQLPGAL